MNLTLAQLDNYASQAGFTGGSLATIVAIAMAESGGNPLIRGRSDSRDRGVLQINSFWHPEVSDSCAFDPTCAFKEGYRISQQGQNFNQWTTFKNGNYKQYLSSSVVGSAQTQAAQVAPPGTGTTATFDPFGGIITMLKPLWDWLSDPVRVLKMIAGITFIFISLILLTLPQAEQNAKGLMNFVKNNPEVLAA